MFLLGRRESSLFNEDDKQIFLCNACGRQGGKLDLILKGVVVTMKEWKNALGKPNGTFSVCHFCRYPGDYLLIRNRF